MICFPNFSKWFQDRGIVGSIWSDIEECAEEEAWSMGYLTKENETPLFAPRPDLRGEKGLNPNIETLGDEIQSAKVSPVLLVSIAAILIYFIVKK